MTKTPSTDKVNGLSADWFPSAVPAKPSGAYAHIVLLRVTDSYALFQTDGELNTSRVQAGETNTQAMTRIAMFKRKQTTAERLTGRELLRRHGFLSTELNGKEDDDKVTRDDKGLPICDYNESFCKTCPDCITYGFAIGDSGSEKSKVLSDTAYSLTAYDDSHETVTLNAPYEDGTMSRKGEVTSRINEQDHVKPQVIFPAVITVRDATLPLFQYVLNNIVRSKRYGAQTTRTGAMSNHVVGVVLADGEIFSNLRFTQALFDALQAGEKINGPDPVVVADALTAAEAILKELLSRDRVSVSQHLTGEALRRTLAALPSDETAIKALLGDAFKDSRAYFERYIKKDTEASKRTTAKK